VILIEVRERLTEVSHSSDVRADLMAAMAHHEAESWLSSVERLVRVMIMSEKQSGGING
jgi:hypothetical protein